MALGSAKRLPIRTCIIWRTVAVITSAASVAEAVALINRQKFDVLISDLNIGQPSDGFTVVSVIRRVQPEAVTFILTVTRILSLPSKPFAAKWTIT